MRYLMKNGKAVSESCSGWLAWCAGMYICEIMYGLGIGIFSVCWLVGGCARLYIAYITEAQAKSRKIMRIAIAERKKRVFYTRSGGRLFL